MSELRMNYWLMKTEPSTFSVDDLAAKPGKRDHWDGIRNYQVRNMIRDDMRKGDLVFMYYSSCKEPGIIAIMEIVKEAYPDFTAFDPEEHYYDPKSDPENPRWFMVDVKLKRKLKRYLSLVELKQQAKLKHMRLFAKGNRLSIMPLKKSEWDAILKLELK